MGILYDVCVFGSFCFLGNKSVTMHFVKCEEGVLMETILNECVLSFFFK